MKVRTRKLSRLSATAAAAVFFTAFTIAPAVATTATPAAGALFDVSCPAADFCLAVGESDALTSALVYRGSGSGWSLVDAPAPPAGWDDVRFTAVSCPSETSCVVLGELLRADGTKLIAQRWNGTSWSPLPVERPGEVGVEAISCTGPQRCVAVGRRDRHLGRRFAPQALAWVLRRGELRLVTPVRPTISTGLSDVSCVGPTNCTAVGAATARYSRPLVEHWNGRAWREIDPEPSTPPGSALSAVECLAPGVCTAVGRGGATRQPRDVLIEQQRSAGWRAHLLPYVATDIPPTLTSVSCLSRVVCAVAGVNQDVDGDKPILGWRDRRTRHFELTQPPAFFFDVSCSGITCTYVGTELQTGGQPAHPVVYRGRGLHPAQQPIPLP
jgi:hypothetical protein